MRLKRRALAGGDRSPFEVVSVATDHAEYINASELKKIEEDDVLTPQDVIKWRKGNDDE